MREPRRDGHYHPRGRRRRWIGGLARGRGIATCLWQARRRRAGGGNRIACGFPGGSLDAAVTARHAWLAGNTGGRPGPSDRRPFKLATEHVDWQGEGSRFFHAHGDIGTEIGGTPFYKYLVLQALKGRLEAPENYSLAAVAARLGRFARPMGDEKALTSSFTYGFHLDEPAYVAYLAAHAAQLGVRRVSAPLAAATRLPGGEVEALRLANGEQVAGDLFLDCSGAESLLMSELGPGAREDWSAWLPCDRMLSARAPLLQDAPPVTRTVATDAGWWWRMPLARDSVAGYVYSSAYASDEAALRQLQLAVPGLGSAKFAPLASGRRRRFWEKNCIALGASAMQLEPLAGADLHFAQLGLGTLIELFPLDVAGAIEAAEYNRVMAEHADSLRDFTMAHYRAGRSRPGAFLGPAARRSAAATPGRQARPVPGERAHQPARLRVLRGSGLGVAAARRAGHSGRAGIANSRPRGNTDVAAAGATAGADRPPGRFHAAAQRVCSAFDDAGSSCSKRLNACSSSAAEPPAG